MFKNNFFLRFCDEAKTFDNIFGQINEKNETKTLENEEKHEKGI